MRTRARSIPGLLDSLIACLHGPHPPTDTVNTVIEAER